MVEYMEDNKLLDVLHNYSQDDVVRALQSTLGYDSNTYLPTIDEFLENDYYLGRFTDNGSRIYPYWREKLRVWFPNPLTINYDTIFLRGCIGAGKSTIASIICAYIIQKMVNMKNPHKFFGFVPTRELVVFLYSSTEATINSVMYSPLIDLLESSPFFQANMIFDSTRENATKKKWHLKNNIVIDCGSSIQKNIGRDIFLAVMDEIQVERIHGQNLANYNSLKMRIKSRYTLDKGMSFNTLMILSGSAGGSDSFAEELTKKNTTNSRSYIDSAKQWEVKPREWSGRQFKVFIGNESMSPKILASKVDVDYYTRVLGEDVAEQLVIDVPEEYRSDFEDDLLMAIRDLAGCSTRSSLAFITNVGALKDSFSIENRFFDIPIIYLPFYDDIQIQDYLIKNGEKIKDRLINPNTLRFIHIDLGIVSDLTGISMSHIAGYTQKEIVNEKTGRASVVREPWYINDFNIGISREHGEETNISKIRDFILYLRNNNVSIGMVTADGYQSKQLIQELDTNKIKAEELSVGTNSDAWELIKRLINDHRMLVAKNDACYKQFLEFQKEISPTNGKVKIYHPGTKEKGSHGDIAESLVGSIYNAYLLDKNGLDPLAGIHRTFVDGEDLDFDSEEDMAKLSMYMMM